MRQPTSLCCGAPIIHTDICSDCLEHTTPEYICKNCGYDKGCHHYKTWQCCYTPDAPGVPMWAETRFEAMDENIPSESQNEEDEKLTYPIVRAGQKCLP